MESQSLAGILRPAGANLSLSAVGLAGPTKPDPPCHDASIGIPGQPQAAMIRVPAAVYGFVIWQRTVRRFGAGTLEASSTQQKKFQENCKFLMADVVLLDVKTSAGRR